MAFQHPPKLLRSTISISATGSTQYGVAPFATITNKWNATLSIPTAQIHGDSTTTNSGIYDGRDVNVGDYIASDGEGRVLKISAITSKNYNTVVCVLEDVDIYNALQNINQNFDGMISNGAAFEAYIFEVKSGRPILASIPGAQPSNLPANFAAALYTRFATLYPNVVKIGDGTTLKVTKDITDTLNFVAGTNTTLVFNDTTKSITINSSVPTASASVLGGVKVGTGLAIDANGVLSAAVSSLAWNGITGKPTTVSGYGITDVYTKTEVDNLISGLDVKQSVKVVSTANITLSGTQTIDGVVLAVGDRVLVAGQTTGAQNGIYVVSATAWTRATDADNTGNTSEVTTGMYTFVEQGTVNANSGWILSTTGTITLGTTSLTFSQFNGLGQITAGTGLTKTGNTLSITNTAVTAASYGSASSVATFTVNAQGQLTAAGSTAIAIASSAVSGLAASATTDTTNAANISSGTLNAARLPAFTGDATSTAGTSALALSTTGVTAGTYKSVTVDAKGRISAGTNPTTLAGYGITDAQALDADLTAIGALTGTSGILKKTAANTWSLDTNTYALSAHTHSNATSSTNGFMSSTDKAKLDAYPTAVADANVASVFSFTVTFDGATGNPAATNGVTNLPTGWTAAISGADITITHTAGVPVKMVNYWGRTTATGTDHFRMPTSANELTIPYVDINTKFTFRINTSIAGADAGGTARIIAYF